MKTIGNFKRSFLATLCAILVATVIASCQTMEYDSQGPSGGLEGKGSREYRSPEVRETLVKGKKYALIIAVDRFQFPGRVPVKELPVLKRDAESMARTLRKAGYEVTIMHSGTDPRPTRHHIIATVDKMAGACMADNTFLVYFSGHGEDEFLYTYNFETSGTALKLGDLTESIKKSAADQKLLFIDSCYSGGAGDTVSSKRGYSPWGIDMDALDKLRGKGFYILTSC